jgi:hypothetical protein
MRILHLSDIHGNAAYFNDIEAELKSVDLVLVSGDITHFGDSQDAAGILAGLQSINSSVLAVSGNCDDPGINTYLDEQGINLHLQVKEKDGIQFTGLAGSLTTPFNTLQEYREGEYAEMLEQATSKLSQDMPHVLVSHNPPYKTKADRVMYIKHLGSKSVKEYIERCQPVLCLSGHIHESHGTEKVGHTMVVNPGAFKSGRYAIIELGNGEVKVDLKQFR